MADKLLKSIKFPTLPDRYVIGDSTLTEEGAAADAKATGDEITNVKSDLSVETANNLIHFKSLKNESVNDVQVSTSGNGVFSLQGRATASGGRTIKLTNVFHLSSGDYTLSAYNLPDNFTVMICDAVTSENIYDIGATYPTIKRTFANGDYYIGFSVIAGEEYNSEIAVSLYQGSLDNPSFIPSYVANDIVARRKIEEAETEISEINEEISVLTTELSPEFEQGTVSSNGKLNANPNRIRTKEILLSKFEKIEVDVDHNMWVAQYNADGIFLRIDTTNRRIILPENLGENTKYVRLVVVNNDASTPILPTDETGFTIKYNFPNNMENMMDEKISNLANLGVNKNRYFSSFKSYAFLLDRAFANSDATVVNDKYVAFGSGNDELTTTDRVTVYEYSNGFDKPVTNIKTLYHLFGHCNSVDYSPVNDCLILGNGSGSYTLQGKIYIIPSFSDIIENDTEHTSESNPLTFANTNAVVIDCSSYNLGTKFNVIWGELNNQRQDIAYLITAKYGSSTSAPDGGDNGTIRRILLGVGSNQLEYGAYSQASESEFNGTFKILKTYTQDGTSYAQCNQGCCYYNGKIYSAIGHDGLWMWEMWLDSNGDKIWYDEYKQTEYGADGNVVINNSTSVCKSENYIFFGQSNVGVMAIPI